MTAQRLRPPCPPPRPQSCKPLFIVGPAGARYEKWQNRTCLTDGMAEDGPMEVVTIVVPYHDESKSQRLLGQRAWAREV